MSEDRPNSSLDLFRRAKSAIERKLARPTGSAGGPDTEDDRKRWQEALKTFETALRMFQKHDP